MLYVLGVTRFAVIFMSFTVVNKMSSRLAETTLQIICKQITPAPCLSLYVNTCLYGRGSRIMPEAEGLFGSVQIWPLSFHAIVSSPAYLSWPLRSCRTSTQ